MSLYLFCLVFLLLLLLFIIFHLVYTNFIEPGAVYFPTPDATVTNMLKLAKVSSADTVLDLGSGDGRLLISAARLGATTIGYEIDPLLVRRSRQVITKAGLSHLASVKAKSLWHADFSSVTIITLYLFPQYMNRLQRLLDKKLDHPTLLISHDYQFPHKKYIKKQDNLYLYRFTPKT
jgi:hypothetical protein